MELINGVTLEALKRRRIEMLSKPRLKPEEYAQRQVEWFNETEGELVGKQCDICKNKGLVAFNDNGVMATRECGCMKERRSLWRIEKSGLKDVIKKYSFANFVTENQSQKDVKATAVRYLADEANNQWFFVGGQVGSGKTHICTAICRKLLACGKEVVYMQWVRDVGFLKYARKDEGEYIDKMNLLTTIEVLYIDDLFKTETGKNPTSAEISLAFEILNYRYNNSLQTIFSSEKILSEILDIDEACGSRIKERCGDYFVEIKRDASKNYRLKQKGAD